MSQEVLAASIIKVITRPDYTAATTQKTAIFMKPVMTYLASATLRQIWNNKHPQDDSLIPDSRLITRMIVSKWQLQSNVSFEPLWEPDYLTYLKFYLHFASKNIYTQICLVTEFRTL
jgi:hypothetical protein